MIVITGPFTLQQGHPYFIGATMDWDRWTWVGKVPERVRFEFKYGPSDSFHENYIVLPLDTTIRTASQLCNIKDSQGQQIINQQQYIGWWNTQTQQVEYSTESCNEIRFNDFPVESGKVYKIFVQRDASWIQV